MTKYEQGFITKCAELGVPFGLASRMLKLAAPSANWRATRPVRTMTQVSEANKKPNATPPMYGDPGFAGDPKRLRLADKGKPMPEARPKPVRRKPTPQPASAAPAPRPAPAPQPDPVQRPADTGDDDFDLDTAIAEDQNRAQTVPDGNVQPAVQVWPAAHYNDPRKAVASGNSWAGYNPAMRRGYEEGVSVEDPSKKDVYMGSTIDWSNPRMKAMTGMSAYDDIKDPAILADIRNQQSLKRRFDDKMSRL